MIFRSGRDESAGVAVAGQDGAGTDAEPGELFAQIEALTEKNRTHRELNRDRRILRLRHQAGTKLLEEPAEAPRHAEPAFDELPNGSALPELRPDELTPGLLRAGILTHGCVLVRGLVDPDTATRLAQDIDRAFEARDAAESGETAASGYYEEFVPDPPYSEVVGRGWVAEAGGIWAGDSAPLMFDLLETFDAAGLKELINGYLGETAALSVDKCTLRKVDPADTRGAWHQDGKFLGNVRSLNVWLSLSHCGDDAPGLDIVPARIDRILETGTKGVPETPDGGRLPWAVSPTVVRKAAGDAELLRPIFEPGDAMLFDEKFLHSTASNPTMPRPRYAIESWFFGTSAFPGDYVPVAF
jgi:hypothetical protein